MTEIESLEDVEFQDEEQEEEFKREVEEEIENILEKYQNNRIYLYILFHDRSQTGVFVELESYIYINTDNEIPRKELRDNWVRESKQVHDFFYSLGFDSWSQVEKIGEHDGNVYWAFLVDRDQGKQVQGSWVCSDRIRSLNGGESDESMNYMAEARMII